MDANIKDYILTFLFLKYISDKYLNDPKAMIVVHAGCAFPDMVSLKSDDVIQAEAYHFRFRNAQGGIASGKDQRPMYLARASISAEL